MADDLKDSFLRNSVRARLKEHNVKLWIAPYILENGEPNVTVFESLAEEYSTQLKLEKQDCLQMLLSLQDNALKRIKQQEHFQTGGLATLNIRLSGFGFSIASTLPGTSKTVQNGPCKTQAQVAISLASTGKDLEDAVSQISGKPSDQLKLIFQGRLLKKEENLMNQGIKVSSQIMAIALSDEANEVNEYLEHEKFCEKTRSAASTLSKKSNQFAYLELENQDGGSLKLDQKEKEALCLALALHERGRATLKRGRHSLALLLFLEADREFRQCNSDLLKSVDNIALLHLDIVWCYLCLRSISHIPDADRRLDQCEVSLERSYGKNLERVTALKGTAGNEAALLMRLHLLQGIVAFHLNRVDRARELLRKAELELQTLKVNTDDMTKIVALGYTTSEALLGLRACGGDLDAAVYRICEWQEERKKAREQNKRERAKERARIKLGKTADGSQYIEPDCVDILCGMGYDRYVAISALKHSNNNMTQAVHLLQEQPHLLDAKKKCVSISDEDVTQIAAMGFDTEFARLALRKHNGCIEDAVSDLVSNGGIISVDPDQLPPEEETDNFSNSTASGSDGGDQGDTEEERATKRMKQMEAASELEEDLIGTEIDYLCFTLEEEENFLNEYKALLS